MEGNANRQGDRRSQGITRTIAVDGNGGKDDRLVINVKTIRGVFAALTAIVVFLLTVGGAVMGGVKYGIGSEVHEEIERECEPQGMIDKHVRTVATELVDEFQLIVEDNIADASVERQEQRERSIRLEQRQIFIQEKMDDDKEDLIREIQRAGGGG
jgi:hypothetical protein